MKNSYKRLVLKSVHLSLFLIQDLGAKTFAFQSATKQKRPSVSG